MAIIAGDWTVDRTLGDIRYIGDTHPGSPTYATVIEFHRWVQGLADDAVASGDDELDITNENPTARSTDNIITLLGSYNIDEPTSQHLYDGSIIQGGGDTVFDGIVNFGNAAVQIQIIQNGVVVPIDWWNQGGAGLNANATAGISHRFMLPVRDSGTDIDGRRILGTCRRYGFTYSEFLINGSARGNNVLALSDAADLNNTTVAATVGGWTTIDNTTEGYVAIDVNNDGTNDYFYSEWNKASYTINQFYERMKYLTRDGGDTSGDSIYGIPGELFRGITHQIYYTSLTGIFDEGDSVSWTGASVGMGQVLADSGDTMWIQTLVGDAPAGTASLNQTAPDAATATVDTVIDRSATIATPFIGASTGSAIIGAYGVGIEYLDLTNNDTLFDLTNTVKNPPNNVTNKVSGIVLGEDRVLVAPYDGVTTDNEGNPAINKNQLSLNTTLSADNMTWVMVTDGDETAIPADTPATGYIRVIDDSGFERRLHYTSWTSGDTFIIDTTDNNEDFNTVNATAGNDVYITYLDTVAGDSFETYTGVYASNRNLVVLVRDGDSTPIKEFISSWTFTSSNASISAIRTTDE